MTSEEINKMIEDRIAEAEKKRFGVPLSNADVDSPLSLEILSIEIPPRFSFPQTANL